MTDVSGVRDNPGPGQLPGIEGFYLLTPRGELGRYQSDGRFVAEADLTSGLADKIDVLMRQYRDGSEEPVIGLVTPSSPEQQWRCASLVFSDSALREYYRTSSDTEAPLTSFQKRNKTKSVFQGMEVLLDAREFDPPCPRCCPVLFAPEIGGETLCRRYGVASIETGKVLEVLDLMALLPPEEKRHPYLSRMVVEMQRTRIAPEMRSGPDLVLAAQQGAAARAAPSLEPEPEPESSGPWLEDTRNREMSFNDGDPVTYWLLGLFSPFNELNDLQRQFIARGYTVTKINAGRTLVERGSLDDLSVYLIEGTIELEAFDGKRIDIVGGTRRASLPISQLRPHAYTVKAATDVTVILVSQKMIRDITRITTTYKNRPGIEVSEMSSLPDGIPG